MGSQRISDGDRDEVAMRAPDYGVARILHCYKDLIARAIAGGKKHSQTIIRGNSPQEDSGIYGNVIVYLKVQERGRTRSAFSERDGGWSLNLGANYTWLARLLTKEYSLCCTRPTCGGRMLPLALHAAQ